MATWYYISSSKALHIYKHYISVCRSRVYINENVARQTLQNFLKIFYALVFSVDCDDGNSGVGCLILAHTLMKRVLI